MKKLNLYPMKEIPMKCTRSKEEKNSKSIFGVRIRLNICLVKTSIHEYQCKTKSDHNKNNRFSMFIILCIIYNYIVYYNHVLYIRNRCIII